MEWCFWKADSLKDAQYQLLTRENFFRQHSSLNKACYSYLGLICYLDVLWTCFLEGALTFWINEWWTGMRKHFIKFNSYCMPEYQTVGPTFYFIKAMYHLFCDNRSSRHFWRSKQTTNKPVKLNICNSICNAVHNPHSDLDLQVD